MITQAIRFTRVGVAEYAEIACADPLVTPDYRYVERLDKSNMI